MASKKKAAKAKRTRKPTAKKEAPTMTEQLKEARERYTVSKSANGTSSAHNGDDVATLLAGNMPYSVCATGEQLAGLKKGELANKYAP